MDRSLLGSLLILVLGLTTITLGTAGLYQVISKNQMLAGIVLLVVAHLIVRVVVQGLPIRP